MSPADFPWGSQWPEGQITEDDITRIDIPVLLGEGEATHNSARVVNRGLAKLFPNVDNCVVKGAGHLSAVDDPVQVAGHIRAHIERAEAAEGIKSLKRSALTLNRQNPAKPTTFSGFWR